MPDAGRNWSGPVPLTHHSAKVEHSSPRPASAEGGPNLEQVSHTSYGPPRPPVQVKPDNNDARKG